MRIFLGVIGFALFVLATALAFYLLSVGKFTGSEFTAFVVAFAVLGVVIGFAPEVQEISIVGNVVKLKEVKAEALKAIASLNESRIEMLRIFLGLALKSSGGFASNSPIDPRAHHFWKLLALVKEYGCLEELKAEVTVSVKVLIVSQLRNISRRNRSEKIIVSEPFLDPLELAAVAFDSTGIEAAKAATSPPPENYREEIKEALEEYSKFYELMIELEG